MRRRRSSTTASGTTGAWKRCVTSGIAASSPGKPRLRPIDPIRRSAPGSGLELNLQVGGDFKVNPQFAVGPYAQLSIGQYSSQEGSSIPDKGMHEWIGFGVRGKFDL